MLVFIEANPGVTPSALGQVMGVQRANMVPLVVRLEASGYLARVEVDGRSFGLTLTEQGAEICTKVKGVIATHQRQILERIPEAHREHLIPALKALWP